MSSWRDLFGKTRKDTVRDAREALREASQRWARFVEEHRDPERERERMPDEALERPEGDHP